MSDQPRQAMTAHCGVLDPAEAAGTPAEVALAFKKAYRLLNPRISVFTSVPLPSLDRSVKNKPREIGEMEGENARSGAPLVPSFGRRIARMARRAHFSTPVVDCGITTQKQKLAAGNVAAALLCNTISDRPAIRVVLILIFGRHPRRAKLDLH